MRMKKKVLMMLNKLTDAEIMSAFKNCLFECDTETQKQICENCPYYKYKDCTELLVQDLFNIINRQEEEKKNLEIELQAMRNAANGFKAEVERLRDNNNLLTEAGQEWQRRYKTAKAEAYKEFTERLKNEIISDTAYGCDINQHTGYYDYQIKIGDIPEYIDNLLNELVGDIKEKRKNNK